MTSRHQHPWIKWSIWGHGHTYINILKFFPLYFVLSFRCKQHFGSQNWRIFWTPSKVQICKMSGFSVSVGTVWTITNRPSSQFVQALCCSVQWACTWNNNNGRALVCLLSVSTSKSSNITTTPYHFCWRRLYSYLLYWWALVLTYFDSVCNQGENN